MALQGDAVVAEDPEKKRRFGPTQDPTFYEGKTPVLGADVSVQQPAGEIGFPQASPAAAPEAPTAPTMPTPPRWPGFPQFELQFPSFNFNPGEPPTPPDIQGPSGPRPAPPAPSGPPGMHPEWWQTALNMVPTVMKVADVIKQVGTQPAEGAWPTWSPEDLTTFPGMEGPGPGRPTLNQEVGEGDFGPPPIERPPPQDVALENVPGEGPSLAGANPEAPANLGGAALGGLSTALGAYGAATAPTAAGKATGAIGAGLSGYQAAQNIPQLGLGAASAASAAPNVANLAAGTTTLGGSIIPGIQTALGAYNIATAQNAGQQAMGAGNLAMPLMFGPAGALVSLPIVLGKLYEAYGKADKVRFPSGWSYLPGTGNDRGIGGLGIDPASGRVVKYLGDGKYDWSDETKRGQPASPAMMRRYGIVPTGALATRPGYENLQQQILEDAFNNFWSSPTPATSTTPDGTPQTPGAPETPQTAFSGAPYSGHAAEHPAYLNEGQVRMWSEQQRQPFIDRIRAQFPWVTDPGQIWQLYLQYFPQEEARIGGIAITMSGPPGGVRSDR